MAERKTKNTAVLAKIEATYGVDAAPSGAANAMYVSNLSPATYTAQNVSRDAIRPYFGASEELVGTAYMQVGFDVELAGSGTAGQAPAWGPLLRACGFSEVITAGDRVEYAPVTDAMEAATIYYFDDGVLKKLLGVRGTVAFKLGLGERPVMSYTFTGLDGGYAATANPGVTLTTFKTPLVVTDPNSGDITFGATYTAGVIAGGIAYPSRGLQLDIGNTVNHMPLLGAETVEITDRQASGSFELDLSAAQEVAFMADVKANALRAVGFLHGKVPGNVVGLFAPAVQLFNPKSSDFNGKRLVGYDARFVPVAGNDEVRIVLK